MSSPFRLARTVALSLTTALIAGAAFGADRPPPSKHPLPAKAPTGVSVWTFKNKTGLPDDAVFVQIPDGTLTNVCGGPIASPVCFTSSGGQVYSLKQLTGSMPNAGKGARARSKVPMLFLDTATSARLIVTLGSKSTATNIVQGLVEMTLSQSSPNNNLDVSYVNSVSLPMSLSVRNRSNGSLYPVSPTGLWPTNQVTTSDGSKIFSNLAAVVPTSAITTSAYPATSGTGSAVGTVSGTIAVTAPSTNATGYHDWSALIGSGATVLLGSYQVPAGQPLPSVLYGFSQVPYGGVNKLPNSPFNTNPSTLAGPTGAVSDSNNAFLAGQSYTLTATFSSDLNPEGGNSRISNLGTYSIPAGTNGVKISGFGGASGAPSSTAAGSFDIYITKAQLNAATGIYGANPPYVVDWTGSSVQSAVATNNTNSLADRVVGDLMAAATFGMISNTTQIGAQMTKTSTTADFANTQWSASTKEVIGSLSTGQYFYLLALQKTPAQFAQWAGSGIQSNSDYYDVYGNAFQSLTQAYAFAYSDRINSSVALDPDLFYSGGSTPPDIDQIYIEIELQPGGYTYSGTASK